MEIKQSDNKLVIKGDGIDCTYSDKKISGKGARKHKSEIEKAIADYNMDGMLTEAKEIYNSSNDDYKELATLSFMVDSLSPNIKKNKVNVAVSAHGNSIRLFRKIWEKTSVKDMQKWFIPYDKVFTYVVEA